jgi:hypothetical protein
MGLRPTQGDENAFSQQPLSMEASPSPLSSREFVTLLVFIRGFLNQHLISDRSFTLPFVIPSVAEGSAVLRTFLGNVFRQSASYRVTVPREPRLSLRMAPA